MIEIEHFSWRVIAKNVSIIIKISWNDIDSVIVILSKIWLNKEIEKPLYGLMIIQTISGGKKNVFKIIYT